MSNTIVAGSASGSYPIMVGSGILQQELQQTFSSFQNDSVFVLIDESVNEFHGKHIFEFTENFFNHTHRFEVPRGEESKSISFWNRCVDFLLDNRIRRNTPVLVIGGGVTGDVGGFAAASVLRGVPLIHIPTTLLAMVDSSIGGKTGINHRMGKNLIGAFYQPKKVIADISLLQTLPENEWINGLSEILKYGAIKDSSIFDDAQLFLENDFTETEPGKLIRLITKCIQVKVDVVTDDEFEDGIRAFLNFGHTFAHALEKACGFKKMSHGEAVYLGMLAACKLSNLTGSNLETDTLKKFSSLYHYRVSKEELSCDVLTKHMYSDKKRNSQFIRFVLLEAWQHPVLKTVNDDTLIYKAWNSVLEEL